MSTRSSCSLSDSWINGSIDPIIHETTIFLVVLLLQLLLLQLLYADPVRSSCSALGVEPSALDRRGFPPSTILFRLVDFFRSCCRNRPRHDRNRHPCTVPQGVSRLVKLFHCVRVHTGINARPIWTIHAQTLRRLGASTSPDHRPGSHFG